MSVLPRKPFFLNKSTLPHLSPPGYPPFDQSRWTISYLFPRFCEGNAMFWAQWRSAAPAIGEDRALFCRGFQSALDANEK